MTHIVTYKFIFNLKIPFYDDADVFMFIIIGGVGVSILRTQ